MVTGRWTEVGGLAVAVAVFGSSFGVLATTVGLTTAQAIVMSVLVFAGGAQFAAVGVVAAGGTPLAALVSALLLNARFIAFGMAVGPLLRGSLWRRLLGAQFMVDEPSALALAVPDPEAARRTYWRAGAAIAVAWVGGTALGALLGSAVADPEALGIDAAFPAGFLAILAPLLRDRASQATALAGGALAAAMLPVAPPGVPVIAAAAAVGAGLLVRATRGHERGEEPPTEGGERRG